jgi:hypothetical protein
MKNLAAGRCFRTRTKGQGRKSVTPPRLAIDATVEESGVKRQARGEQSALAFLSVWTRGRLGGITAGEIGWTDDIGFLGLMTVDGHLLGMDRNDITAREAASMGG